VTYNSGVKGLGTLATFEVGCDCYLESVGAIDNKTVATFTQNKGERHFMNGGLL